MFKSLRELGSLEPCKWQSIIIAELVAETDCKFGLQNIIEEVNSTLFRYIVGILKLDKVYTARETLENIHSLRKPR